MYVLLYSMYQYFSPFYKWIIFHFTDIPHCLSIHQLIRYLSCFHFLAIMNNAAVDIHIQASVWTFVFISLGYISRCGERQFFLHAGNSSPNSQLLSHQHHFPHFSDPISLNFHLLPCSHVFKEGDIIASPIPAPFLVSKPKAITCTPFYFLL